MDDGEQVNLLYNLSLALFFLRQFGQADRYLRKVSLSFCNSPPPHTFLLPSVSAGGNPISSLSVVPDLVVGGAPRRRPERRAVGRRRQRRAHVAPRAAAAGARQPTPAHARARARLRHRGGKESKGMTRMTDLKILVPRCTT